MTYILNVNEKYGYGSIGEKQGLHIKGVSVVSLARTISPDAKEFLNVARILGQPHLKQSGFPELDRAEKLQNVQMVFLRCLVMHLNSGTEQSGSAQDHPYSLDLKGGFVHHLRENGVIDEKEGLEMRRSQKSINALRILRDDGTGTLREFCTLTPHPDLFDKFEKILPAALADAFQIELELPQSKRPSGAPDPERGGFGLGGGK